MYKKGFIIKYEFADGTTSEIEVDNELGEMVTSLTRTDENLSRKERYHCPVSLEQMDYEGEIFADYDTPEAKLIKQQEEKKVEQFLLSLSDLQRNRVNMLLEGKSMREIAKIENKDCKTIRESILAVRKKAKEFFNTQAYFETEEGQKEFAAWQAERQQKQLNIKLNKKEESR